jgi:hypothetical protein
MIEVRVLNKILVKEYYRLNAGFFLVIITVAFGFMSGTEHHALAEFFIASPLLLFVPIGMWAIYLLKIINFNRSQVNLPQNQFLYTFNLWSYARQVLPFFLIVVTQFMPAILYGFFLIVMALKNAFYVPVVIIPIALFLFLLIGTVTLLRQLNHVASEATVGILKKYLDHRLTKPLTQFYLEYLTRQDPALIFGTKIFSGLLIFAVTQLYSGESYDVRLLAMGCALSFSASFMVIRQIHYFENKVFVLLRNLPIPVIRRTTTFLFVFLILCLPEITIIIKYFPDALNWMEAPSVILFGISTGLLFYGLHFTEVIHQKNFERPVFALVIGWILLILFRVPVFVLVLANSGIGIWLVGKYFYRFEQSVPEN